MELREVVAEDIEFWWSLDQHLSEKELRRKIMNHECYVIFDDQGKRVGILRYNLFWDNTPFLNLIYLEDAARGQGLGKQALTKWEAARQAEGFTRVLTSAQSDEDAQRFYRRCGYADCGCLVLDDQPTELFFVKKLGVADDERK